MRSLKNFLFYGLGLLFLSLVSQCSEKESSPYPKTVTIEYSVTSPNIKAMNVSYTNSTGTTTLESSVVLPFNKKFTREVQYMDGAMIDLIVINGSIDAKILVDGVVVKQQTCTGTSTTVVMCKAPYVFM